MRRKLSPKLRELLEAWLTEVATAGHMAIVTSQGLCTYCDRSLELRNMLVEDFGPAYLYPFGGEARYDREQRTHTMHKNELRIAWVRKQLGVE